MNEVLSFINAFKSSHPREIEDCFLHGNCYWFAHILAERFKGGVIYYLPIDNHFVCFVGGKYYDISGEVKVNYPYYAWNFYKVIEPLESHRIIRDCIEKKSLS